ncbi:MAG: hypothetical protein AB1391_01175 [Candidatus Micrarchaeota archaeon]
MIHKSVHQPIHRSIHSSVHASAPGKILWIGGYSVLEKNSVSLVTAVSARVHAYAKKRKDGGFGLNMPQFGIKCNKISELSEDEKKTARFVISAIDTTKLYLNSKGKKIIGCEIKTISDDAFSVNSGKSGLGSSAAVTVAAVAVLLALNGFGKNKKLVHKISQYAHALAQGKVGSGFDIACATYGTICYTCYSPSLVNIIDNSQIEKTIESPWDCSIKEMRWPKNFYIVVGNFKNKSTSTTEMVKRVMDFKKKKPEEYTKLICELNKENEKAIKAISDRNSHALNLDEFVDHFNKGRLLTKKLGDLSGAEIESMQCTEIIELIIKGGALVAKLPGAGGGDSICAICLSNKKAKDVSKLLEMQGNIEILNVQIENKGFEVGF